MSEVKIMILEDEPALAYTLSEALKKNFGAGSMVNICPTAEAALQLIEIQPFDLIITDWRLPGVSGLDFITQVRQSLPDVPVIFMTAFGSESLEKQAQKVSDYYLTKPFEIPELTYATNQLLMISRENHLPVSSANDQERSMPYHVLILEDDESLLRLYRKVFQKSGYTVHTAQTLEGAYELLGQEKFDLFLCDVKIGKTFGIDLLLIWRDKLTENNTKVIVISGDPWYRLMSKKIGADFFLEKPVEMAALVGIAKSLAPSTNTAI
jgi:DNA-binding response OmpR family regulator